MGKTKHFAFLISVHVHAIKMMPYMSLGMLDKFQVDKQIYPQ